MMDREYKKIATMIRFTVTHEHRNVTWKMNSREKDVLETWERKILRKERG